MIALSLSLPAAAQENVMETSFPEENVWHPTFMGQDKNAFSKWVKEHQRYPEKAKKEGVTGRVVASFVIDEKGRMKDVQIVKGVHPLLDKETLRVIKSAPKKWTPGTKDGKPFAFKYYLTVIWPVPICSVPEKR